jgi:hypothetical protein
VSEQQDAAGATGSAGSVGTARSFVHPGALDSKEELDFVKAQIHLQAEPWAGEFQKLKSSAAATRVPHGLTHIDSRSQDSGTSRDDAIAAYAQALLWYYSGEEAYAERSLAILKSWASLEGFTAGSDQDKLQAGWIGAVLAPAAEIMRLYPGFAAADIAQLKAMFERAFYPQLNTASTWNGNVDLTQIDAMMAIAVFNDDRAEFELGLTRLRARVPSYFYLAPGPVPPIAGDGGDMPAFWSHPAKWVSGLMQETCRDNGHHAQYALGSAIHAAEVAWHQGVDVYTEFQPRFTAAMELLASQLLTGNMHGTCNNEEATRERYNTWEVAYNHYNSRKGVPLPQTSKLILTQIRPSASRADWNLVYETLTHAAPAR